jgi:hypothetical protein
MFTGPGDTDMENANRHMGMNRDMATRDGVYYYKIGVSAVNAKLAGPR